MNHQPVEKLHIEQTPGSSSEDENRIKDDENMKEAKDDI